MPLLAVTYLKGAAGVTTTALGLAATAPADVRPVLVECDSAGGDLMLRHGLTARPSLVDLAAAARTNPAGTTDVFEAGVQKLHLGGQKVDVVVAPSGGAQTRAALPELTRPGKATLNPLDRLTIADCGRLDAGSPARPLVAAAQAVIVLVVARADDLAHLREHLADLVDLVTGRLVVLLTPGSSYGPAEVRDVLAGHIECELARQPDLLVVTGPLPHDRRGAEVLCGRLVAGRRWRRLPLLATLDRSWASLAPLLEPDATRATETA
jgi:hypothetical protein